MTTDRQEAKKLATEATLKLFGAINAPDVRVALEDVRNDTIDWAGDSLLKDDYIDPLARALEQVKGLVGHIAHYLADLPSGKPAG